MVEIEEVKEKVESRYGGGPRGLGKISKSL